MTSRMTVAWQSHDTRMTPLTTQSPRFPSQTPRDQPASNIWCFERNPRNLRCILCCHLCCSMLSLRLFYAVIYAVIMLSFYAAILCCHSMLSFYAVILCCHCSLVLLLQISRNSNKKGLQNSIDLLHPECSKVTFLSPWNTGAFWAPPLSLNLLYAMGNCTYYYYYMYYYYFYYYYVYY